MLNPDKIRAMDHALAALDGKGFPAPSHISIISGVDWENKPAFGTGFRPHGKYRSISQHVLANPEYYRDEHIDIITNVATGLNEIEDPRTMYLFVQEMGKFTFNPYRDGSAYLYATNLKTIEFGKEYAIKYSDSNFKSNVALHELLHHLFNSQVLTHANLFEACFKMDSLVHGDDGLADAVTLVAEERDYVRRANHPLRNVPSSENQKYDADNAKVEAALSDYAKARGKNASDYTKFDRNRRANRHLYYEYFSITGEYLQSPDRSYASPILEAYFSSIVNLELEILSRNGPKSERDRQYATFKGIMEKHHHALWGAPPPEVKDLAEKQFLTEQDCAACINDFDYVNLPGIQTSYATAKKAVGDKSLVDLIYRYENEDDFSNEELSELLGTIETRTVAALKEIERETRETLRLPPSQGAGLRR